MKRKRERSSFRANGTCRNAPASAHLCKVEHHPGGAQLSHAYAPYTSFSHLRSSPSSRSSTSLGSFSPSIRSFSPPLWSSPRLPSRSFLRLIRFPPSSSSLSLSLLACGMLWNLPPSLPRPRLPPNPARTADSRKGSATPKLSRSP